MIDELIDLFYSKLKDGHLPIIFDYREEVKKTCITCFFGDVVYRKNHRAFCEYDTVTDQLYFVHNKKTHITKLYETEEDYFMHSTLEPLIMSFDTMKKICYINEHVANLKMENQS